jgi:hypothetical protein
LVVCRLAGCILSGPINWPSLRELSLKQVKICDQRIFDNLVFTCPFIEKFALVECDGLKYLHLSGLRKLKKVKVKRQSFPLMEKIEIDVVSLHTFSYSPFYFEKTHIDLTVGEFRHPHARTGGVLIFAQRRIKHTDTIFYVVRQNRLHPRERVHIISR